MGSASNSLNFMEIRCNQEHPSITRLKKLLPPEVLALVVKRIAKGDTLTSISRYLHLTEKDIADETFRKWLQPLAIEVRELLVEKMPIEDVAKIIGDSSAATASPVAGRPPGPSAGSSKRLKAIVSNVDKDLRSEMMFKYLWATEQKRLDKMLDLEERLGVLLPNVPKEIDTMKSIADSLLKVELGRWALINGGYIPEMPTPEPGSFAEKVSKLDQVDRNLIRTAWGHVMDIFEDKALELQAEQDRKKNAANPENEDHHEHREIQEKSSPSTNNPPKKTADPFLIG